MKGSDRRERSFDTAESEDVRKNRSLRTDPSARSDDFFQSEKTTRYPRLCCSELTVGPIRPKLADFSL